MVELSSVLPDSLKYPSPRLPFRDAWRHYADAGLCPIPVLDTPPSRFLQWSRMKAEQWAEDDRWAYAQTAITLPDGLVMLDDDDYQQTAALEAQLGPRPATLYSTSRGSGALRRKSLFRVPEGTRFAGEYPGGEVIDSRHRFAFVCPTVNRRTCEVEEWYAPNDSALQRFPTAEDVHILVCDLPPAWVNYLSRNARSDASERPYAGPTAFRSGDLSVRVLAVATRHADTSRYPEANGALMSLAWVAVRHPDDEGIETLRDQIASAYVGRTDTTTAVSERRARMDRAWESALATQAAQYAAEWAAVENEVGTASAAWYRNHTPSTRHEQLDVNATLRSRMASLTPFERAVMGDPSGYAEERAKRTQAAAPRPESSWTPRDLSDVMADGYEPPRPTIFRRTDGVGLFYPGVVNEFHAVGGTGKTMAALAVCHEALREDLTVLYVDYEEHPGRIVQRLRGYGVRDDTIRSRFLYVRPSEKPTPEALTALLKLSPSVVLIDTFAESFRNLTSGDSNRTDDVTSWFALPRLFADAGACVIVTDHIPKDAQNKLMPIGSQAKHSGYKGAIYYLEAPAGKGLVKNGHGQLRFVLGKDNGGEMGVRAGESAGTFHLDTTGEVSTWTIQAPDTGAALAESIEALNADRDRILLALRNAGGHLKSRARLWESLGVNKNSTPPLVAALTDLIERGFVLEEKSGNAQSLRLPIRPSTTPEADAERETWAGYTPTPDHVPMSPGLVLEDKEDIGSDVHHVLLDVHLDDRTASRSARMSLPDPETAPSAQIRGDDGDGLAEGAHRPHPHLETASKGRAGQPRSILRATDAELQALLDE